MKILIVEDVATIVLLLKVYMSGWGVDAEIEHVQDGQAGLAKAREFRPDIIISDVQMPKMDGFELCAAIRADPILHKTLFFLLTSLSDEASVKKGQMVGATAFLKKPISPLELRNSIAPHIKLP
jgi:twitching motility two-component system response regulator PilG